MRSHVELRSSQFGPYDGEDAEVNPGRYGKRLAEYLHARLPEQGVEVGEIYSEDWGWVVPVKHEAFPLWVGCGNYDEYPDGFLCFIEPSTPALRRGLFKKIDTTVDVGRVAAALVEFGARDAAPRGGEAVAVVGPLELPVAKSYTAVLSYAVMRPGDSSRVHTHPGPEGWYVLAGEQCLETPVGANRAGAGQTMTVPPNVPMELSVTGTVLRRAFALVIHDSTQERGIPSDWKPSGKCGP